MNEVTYPVNEMFLSIQGEGSHTGATVVFVRLQGCDVGCPWCDTKHTWERKPEHRVASSIMLIKDDKALPTFAVMSANEVVTAAIDVSRGTRHVVITGGEPAMHNLRPLITEFAELGWFVQIESSGTVKLPMSLNYWLTLSPKIDMPGGKKVLATSWVRADEIKLPVGKQADIDRFLDESLLGMANTKKRVYLQPLSQSPKATALCIEYAQTRGWHVSVQTHKYLGLR
jgi:7-carboxy-7-deazaguanine synthase